MRKFLFVLLASSLFASCSNSEGIDEESIIDSTELHPVIFKTSDFKISTTSTRNRFEDFEDIKFIEYTLFTDNNICIREKKQYVEDADFGIIKDALPKGKYIAFFRAMSTNTYTPITYLERPGYWFKNNSAIHSDLFVQKTEFEITDSAIEQEINLKRIVGRLDLTLLDSIPEGIDCIEFSMDKTTPFYIFHESSMNEFYAYTYSRNWEITPDMIGKENTCFSLYLIGQKENISTITLKIKDKNDETIILKTISNVGVYANKITKVTGRLFEEKCLNAGFQINTNDKWETGDKLEF